MKLSFLPVNERVLPHRSRKWWQGVVIGCCLVSSIAVMVRPVLAQDSSAPVFNKPDLDSQIIDLQNTYRGQLEEYRTAERNYVIAKGQYQQLATLVALEDAVKATKNAMIARAEVLKTYTNLLRLQMIQATGVELPQKQQALTQLEAELSALTTHRQHLDQVTDRNGIAAAADEFDTLIPGVQEASYYSLSLLAVGKLQSVYDKSAGIETDLKMQAATASSEIKQGERDRAFAETERIMGNIDGELGTINTDIAKSADKHSASSYQQVGQKLNSIYGELSQILSYLQELLTI